jgi:hypothetical protein
MWSDFQQQSCMKVHICICNPVFGISFLIPITKHNSFKLKMESFGKYPISKLLYFYSLLTVIDNLAPIVKLIYDFGMTSNFCGGK